METVFKERLEIRKESVSEEGLEIIAISFSQNFENVYIHTIHKYEKYV